MALDEEFLKKMDAKIGATKADPSHWIYSEGPSTTFLPTAIGEPDEDPEVETLQSVVPLPAATKPKRPPWNSTAAKLRDALKEAEADGEAVSGDDVADFVELDDSETVEWVASTYHQGELINVYRCQAEGEPDTAFVTCHGDGGSLSSIDGPYESVEAAKASFGRVAEGWSDL